MRNVMQQPALTFHQSGQMLCHAIEILPQISEFVASIAH